MMNYIEALDYIHQIPKFVRPLGNVGLGQLLELLGSPHKGQRYIHIAGTNGKGSTTAFITQILIEAGYRVGMYTSPFINRFNERIQINRTPIADDELANIVSYVRTVAEENEILISEFAFTTAVMFEYFKRAKCDYAVLEVGLGGRLDATNIIDECEVCAITSISLDHTALLGETIKEIATEKCGIIKPHSSVVLYPNLHPDAFEVAIEICATQDAIYTIPAIPYLIDPDAKAYCFDDEIIATPSLIGEYQAFNASVAVELANVLISKGANITNDNIVSGLSNTYWPARLERIMDRLVLDGAHNPDAIRLLCEYYKAKGERVNIVIAMMQDKAVDECVGMLCEIANNVTVCEIDMPRCMRASELGEVFLNAGLSPAVIPSVKDSVGHSLTLEGETLVCGSLYLCSDVRCMVKA